MKIRQARHTNPDALIVATGCSAQVNPQRLAAISGVDLVLGNSEKGDIIHYLASLEKSGASLKKRCALGKKWCISCTLEKNGASLEKNGASLEKNGAPLEKNGASLKKNASPDIRVSNLDQETTLFQSLFINQFSGYTRAFLKIQDGCDHRCSYCIVPTARGKNRSARYDDALSQARQLVESGYQELVLTGIHLGTYGQDLERKTSLSDLLEAMLDGLGSVRLRLSSIEPTEITPALKRLVAQSPRICAHLHIPLQSGDDQILQAMHRPYTSAFYKELIEELVSLRPEISIGADVMAGFPGETDESFQRTFQFIGDLPLAYLHVFSFSQRPGTEAAQMPHQIDGRIKKERCALLRKLGREKFYHFRRRFLITSPPCIGPGAKG